MKVLVSGEKIKGLYFGDNFGTVFVTTKPEWVIIIEYFDRDGITFCVGTKR